MLQLFMADIRCCAGDALPSVVTAFQIYTPPQVTAAREAVHKEKRETHQLLAMLS